MSSMNSSPFNLIRLPKRVSRGQAVKASDYNDLIDVMAKLLASLKYVSLQPSPDLGIRRGPNGTTAWIKNKRRGTGGSSKFAQFEITGLRYDTTSATWKCKVEPGYVLSRNPDASAEALDYKMPTDGDGIPLNATQESDPAGPPEFTVQAGQVIGIRVLSTEKDIIEEDPIVEVGAEDEESTHAQPPNAETTGEYFYKLASFEELPLPEGSPPGAIPQLVVSDVFHEGPLHHLPILPELRNVGGEREIYKSRQASGDYYDFRSLEQMLDGGGAPIIKSLEPGQEEGDTIRFYNLRKNNSGAVPYNITAEEESINFQFTGAEGGYTDPFGGQINFAAGLVTSYTPSAIDGGNLNLEVRLATRVGGGGTWDTSSLMAILYFRNGLFVNGDPGGDPPAGLITQTVIGGLSEIA